MLYEIEKTAVSLDSTEAAKRSYDDDSTANADQDVWCRIKVHSRQFHVHVELHLHP